MPEPVYPRYTLPMPVLLDLASGVVFRQPRCFRRHALAMLHGLQPPLRVIGEANIPGSGPGVIIANHYARPGFWMPWMPAAISAVVRQDVTWVMTAALTFPGWRLHRILRSLSQQLLQRVARVYGFIAMPPMPPVPGETLDRAAAVQRLVAHVRANSRVLVGFAPEGGDQPGGVLSLPPNGTGRLALLLAHRGMSFYPVGAYEEAGRFVLNFGEPFSLEAQEAESRQALDRHARMRMMRSIAACLPAHLRGEF